MPEARDRASPAISASYEFAPIRELLAPTSNAGGKYVSCARGGSQEGTRAEPVNLNLPTKGYPIDRLRSGFVWVLQIRQCYGFQ